MDIDVTFFIQMGFFLTCLIVLNKKIMGPFIAVIEERERRIEGARRDSAHLLKQGDADMEAYRLRIRDARSSAQKARDELKNEGREAERALLAEVRSDIANQLNAARVEVSSAEDQARTRLTTETHAMAQLLVGKILGRDIAR